MKTLKRLYIFLIGLFARNGNNAGPAVPCPAPATADDSSDSPSEWPGAHYFKDDILEKLDDYFYFIRRMKTRDPDAYELYRQIGAHIVDNRAVT
jgi:hypothetical protein